MAIELGIATPAVPRIPAALDNQFGKWAADLDRLTRSFEVAVQLGSPMVLTGCGSFHPTHGYGPHPRNHSAEARARIVEFLRLVAPRAEDHGIILTLECHMITALDTPAH